MTEKQQTFGKTTIEQLDKHPERRPYCSHQISHKLTCQNRAIIKVTNTLNPETEYRCGIHAKDWQLEQVGLLE
jgi:hypothetical protein